MTHLTEAGLEKMLEELAQMRDAGIAVSIVPTHALWPACTCAPSHRELEWQYHPHATLYRCKTCAKFVATEIRDP